MKIHMHHIYNSTQKIKNLEICKAIKWAKYLLCRYYQSSKEKWIFSAKLYKIK